MSEAAISEAIQAEQIFMQSDVERWQYEQREKALRDYISGMRAARRIGLAEGRAEGRAKGLIEGEHHAALRIARMMLAAHKNVAEIEQLCSLSRDEILALQKNDSSM